MTKTEDSYGEYVRELQGKNIGLTQENDNFANQKEKLESRFDEFRTRVYDLVTKLSCVQDKQMSNYKNIMSEYCNKENIKLNPNIWNDLNNIEVLENWLMLLDRMELFSRSEEKNAELKS